MGVKAFIHHLLDPHCLQCREEKRENPTVEILREVLEAERYNNKQLLETILNQVNPSRIPTVHNNELKPVMTASVPWRVRQQMLQQEDKRQAQVVAKKEEERQAEIARLEKELDIADQ